MRILASLAITMAVAVALWGPVYLEAKPWTGARPVEGGMGYEHVYLGAARAVRAGGSPYQVAGYTYPPFLAEALALLDERHAAALWRALVLVSAAVMAWASACQWRAPWGAQAAVAVGLLIFPWTTECLETAQVQLPAGACFAVCLLALRHERPWASGLALAVGLLVKPSCLCWAPMLALGPTRTQARAGTLACAIVAVAAPWIALSYDGGYLAMMRGEAFRAWVADAQNLAPLAGAYWRWSWISPVAVSMLAAGAWAFRRGRADDRRFVQVAPLVALAVLPLVWGYTLTMLYPAVVAWVDEAREKP